MSKMVHPFERLFEPGMIGAVKIKNRVIMPPMGTNFANPDGTPSEATKAYYGERARGGVGLITVEATCWDGVTGRGLDYELRADTDWHISGLAALAKVIHDNGAKAFIQFAHPGAAHSLSQEAPVIRVAPSNVPTLEGAPIPHALSKGEIRELVRKIAASAFRAKQAGFDGLEIHATHGYLFAEFLSPLYNKRTDEYGGDVKGRARFLIEAVKAIKEKCGQGFAVVARVSAEETEPEGVKIKDTQALAVLLEEAGIDAINLSHGSRAAPEPLAVAPPSYPEGVFLNWAEQIKKVIKKPVIAGCRVFVPQVAEQALRDGKADFIFLGRALLADPEWLNKVATGRTDEIVPCIGCQACVDFILYERGVGRVRCSVNHRTGKEWLYPAPYPKVAKPKRVTVVGGGPGGMEAARVAALRGHQVTLYEKNRQLGGQMLVASKPPSKDRIKALTDYYAGQMEKLGISIKLGQEFTVRTIQPERPDAVIVAAGIKHFIPQIAGVSGNNVVIAEEVLSGHEVGRKVVIIGGELVGCETAEFLAGQDREITILRRGKRMATSMGPMLRALLLRRLRQEQVKMRPGIHQYEEIAGNGVKVINELGKEELVPADTVILAAGAIPDNGLAEQLLGKVSEFYCVGDCVRPRSILHAIHEGAKAAWEL